VLQMALQKMPDPLSSKKESSDIVKQEETNKDQKSDMLRPH